MNGRSLSGAALILLGLLQASLVQTSWAGDDDLERARQWMEDGQCVRAETVFENIVGDEHRSSSARDDARFLLALIPRAEARVRSDRGADAEELTELYRNAVESVATFLRDHPVSRHVRAARIERGRILGRALEWARETGEGGIGRTFTRQAASVAADLHGDDLLLAQTLRFEVACLQENPRPALLALGVTVALFAEAEDETRESHRAHHLLTSIYKALAVYGQGAEAWYRKAYDHITRALPGDERASLDFEEIARTYRCIAELALEMRLRIGPHVLVDDAMERLAGMEEAHPTAWATAEALRAQIAWSGLACLSGRVGRASVIGADAVRRSKTIGPAGLRRAALHRQYRVVCLGCGGKPTAPKATHAMELADGLLDLRELDAARRAYERVIACTRETPSDFITWRWTAWWRLAYIYREQEDHLGEALALEPIHEAWMRGWIPHDPSDNHDWNAMRASMHRCDSANAMRTVAHVTESPVFLARYLQMRDGMGRDYFSSFGR